jgi:glutamate dehydrogenase/leucine dehydrogenase
VSYFEWVQNKTGDYWTEDVIISKLKNKMINSFNSIWSIKQEYNVSLRTAAYIKSLKVLNELYNYKYN